MSEQSGEKTEEPTHKKLEDARKKGQVWRSRDLTGVVVFLVCMGVLKALWPWVERELTQLFRFTFDVVAHPVDLQRAMYDMMVMAGTAFFLLTLPIVLSGSVMGAVVDFL